MEKEEEVYSQPARAQGVKRYNQLTARGVKPQTRVHLCPF